MPDTPYIPTTDLREARRIAEAANHEVGTDYSICYLTAQDRDLLRLARTAVPQMASEIEAAWRCLLRYGHHRSRCEKCNTLYIGEEVVKESRPCSCGWDATKRSIEAALKGTE